MEHGTIKNQLKKRVEKSGRRWLEEIWDLQLADDSRGTSLVDYHCKVEDGETAVVDELFGDYKRQYDGYGASTPRVQRSTKEAQPDKRTEELGKIVALEAGRHPFVTAFRREVLKNKLLSDVGLVKPWVIKQYKREGLPGGWQVEKPMYTDVPGLLTYSPDVRVEHGADRSDCLRFPAILDVEGTCYLIDNFVPIKSDGTLGRLKEAAEWLCAAYSAWSEAHAVGFILSGWQPLIVTGIITTNDNQSYPALSRIDMTSLDPRLSPDEVGRLFAEARQQLLGAGRRDKPTDAKFLALAVFGEEHCRGKRRPQWSELLKRWNGEHPAYEYDETDNNFSRDVKNSWSRITGKKWDDGK
jgi:hypothetical protein